MDQNDQSKTTLQKQARRRRNRSKPNTQTVKIDTPVLETVKVPVDPKVKPPQPLGVTEAPKRHRYRNRKRNKTQPVDSIETPKAQTDQPTADTLPSTEPVSVNQPPCDIPLTKPAPISVTQEMKSSVGGGSSPLSKPTKEQVLADREAKRLAKQAAKHKIVDNARDIGDTSPVHENPQASQTKVIEAVVPSVTSIDSAKITPNSDVKSEKSREEVMAEREAKKLAKIAGKTKGKQPPVEAAATTAKLPESAPATTGATRESTGASSVVVGMAGNDLTAKVDQLKIAEKPVLTKAERRAKQEAQRAAKAGQPGAAVEKKVAVKPSDVPKSTVPAAASKKTSPSSQVASSVSTKTIPLHRVKLFNHLYVDRQPPANAVNSTTIHPSVVKLGSQYASRIVVGANARCIAFMNTMKEVIADYETPKQKEFSRGHESVLQPCLNYLQQCRPLSVSISNAMKFIKMQITYLPTDESEAELKEHLLESIDTYIRDQVEKAALAISISVQEKITNGDVILTFGCSSLISHILEEAQKRDVSFRVVVVDARPDHEGQEMLRRLVAQGIRCTCVLINAVAFIMPEVTKVLLGANTLMANGYVMSRAGTAQVALLAKAHNVPVLVCCETHKFSERVQTDAFVYNEIGNPNALVLKSKTTRDVSSLANWETLPHLTPLNLCYDITPPELVTAVVTELAILPCTSVPVILRIQPSAN